MKQKLSQVLSYVAIIIALWPLLLFVSMIISLIGYQFNVWGVARFPELLAPMDAILKLLAYHDNDGDTALIIVGFFFPLISLLLAVLSYTLASRQRAVERVQKIALLLSILAIIPVILMFIIDFVINYTYYIGQK